MQICNNLNINGKGHLTFAGKDTLELAKKYGTPLYLMDEEKIRDRIRVYKKAFEDYANIQREFDKIPQITVFINMGTVTGVSMLKNLEPKFEMELESAGNISSIVRTEFKSVGINQTHHKIYLKIDARVGILTPFSAFGKDINTEVLISEAIIIGEVPDTYYNLEGMDETEDTYNFIE